MDPTQQIDDESRADPRSVDAYGMPLAWDQVMLRTISGSYIRQAWHVVEPSTVYLENSHIDLIVSTSRL